MHVALVTMNGNKQFSGGVTAVVMERARYLCEQGHDVSIVCRAESGFDRHELRDGINIYPIKAVQLIKAAFAQLQSASPIFLRALRSGLEAAHKRQPLDLVDLQDGPAILGVKPFVRAHKVPMVFTLHGSAAANPGKRPWIGRKLHIAYERMAYSAATRVLAVSDWIGQVPSLLGFSHLPLAIVPSPVDESFFDISRRINMYELPLRLLFLGRIVPEKRLEVALHALAQLSGDACHLVVVGDGPDAAAMRALADRLGVANRVTWHGYVKDRDTVRTLVAESHVVLFPTIYEAQGLAVLEAMAAGLHAIVSDIDVMAEMLPAEYRVTPDDPGAFAARIRELSTNRDLLANSEVEMRNIAGRYRRDTLYPHLLTEYHLAINEGIRA